MKQVAQHRVVNGNAATDVTVFRTRDGRGHQVVFGTGGKLVVAFHQGDPSAGLNGVTLEALLHVVRDRLEQHQAGPYACDENQRAIAFSEQALRALEERTARIDREEHAQPELEPEAPAEEQVLPPPLGGDEPTVDLDDPDDKPF